MAEYKYRVTKAEQTTNRRRYRRMIMKGPSHSKLKNAQLDLKSKTLCRVRRSSASMLENLRGKIDPRNVSFT